MDNTLKSNPETWKKVCGCGNIVKYKTYNSYTANKNKNSPCKKCANKLHSKKLKNKKRAPFSKEWKRNIAIGHKKSKIWKLSMNTSEYKEKHRQKMLRLIREGKYGRVGYNLKACKVFDYINKKLNWNGTHAKNGGEKTIDNFILDYYDPVFNVVIEWDEKHHKRAKRKKFDWFRQNIIMKNTGCEFYRVDDDTKLVRKVDNNISDKTGVIQFAINEYYETQK